MNTESHSTPSITRSLIGIAFFILSALVLAFLLAVGTFGLLAPLGVAIVAIASILSGFWLLLNRKGRANSYIATILIFGPFIALFWSVFTVFFGQIRG
jgi:Flp pilus assembly protein TadB